MVMTTEQSVWDTAKAMLRRMFIAVSTYIKNRKTSNFKSLTVFDRLRKARINQNWEKEGNN
jgi:hypothetical protein